MKYAALFLPFIGNNCLCVVGLAFVLDQVDGATSAPRLSSAAAYGRLLPLYAAALK
jgi:hypothetical protein